MLYKQLKIRSLSTLGMSLLIGILVSTKVKAQYFTSSDSAFKAHVPNSARLWGYVFGDYFYKAHADSLNRGGNNQYTNVQKETSEFQFRRIYLGFDYNINKTFSTELLLAAEDDVTSGDVLTNNKFAPYIKLANLRWHDFLFKGNDFLIGMIPTPAYPYATENLFTYSRPVERTITDIRRTPSFDFGAALQGRFSTKDKSISYGYNLMFGNGTGDKPQNLTGPVYKWYYADAFGLFFKNRLFVDVYADYQNQNPNGARHAYRQMNKLSVVWINNKYTIGVEGFVNNLVQSEVGILRSAAKDTLDGKASGISFYAHANIVGTKFRAFARYDLFNPNTNYDNVTYTKYAALYNVASTYEPNNKERFLSVGFDYSPAPNIRLMPNIWYNQYVGQASNLIGSAVKDHDLVYRFTFFFTFGKFFSHPSYAYYPFK